MAPRQMGSDLPAQEGGIGAGENELVTGVVQPADEEFPAWDVLNFVHQEIFFLAEELQERFMDPVKPSGLKARPALVVEIEIVIVVRKMGVGQLGLEGRFSRTS